MELTNKQIRSEARELLDDNIFGKDWLKSVVVFLLSTVIILCTGILLYFGSNYIFSVYLSKYIDNLPTVLRLVIEAVIDIVEILLLNILTGPLSIGISTVYDDLVGGCGGVRIKSFFCGFRRFMDNFILGCMYTLNVTIWSMFFVFPGIYVSYSYAMVFYVKKDHPDYTWKECFDESERIMDGNRWKLFRLHMSFVGWFILGALAGFGIGCLWVLPYVSTSNAIFYDEAKLAKRYND